MVEAVEVREIRQTSSKSRVLATSIPPNMGSILAMGRIAMNYRSTHAFATLPLPFILFLFADLRDTYMASVIWRYNWFPVWNGNG